ncbi:hypothetical protein TUM17384_14600 [Shewanella algae]|uniref:hypothetical protein n=1 Tax=Shewanella algae TaxID=38313 RepID=UPI001BEEFA23|nr:hypothetical protein [Shewanella algae]BCV57515.1 hypothetical protein TUM17384_14600 [Shewanella algae]
MKVLHLSFCPESLFGVQNKIRAQIDGLKENGVFVERAGFFFGGYYFGDDKIISCKNNNAILRKVLEVVIFYRLLFYSYQEYDYIYIRYMRLTPWFYFFIKVLNKKCNSIILEVPTYPYDLEYPSRGMVSFSDKFFRERLHYHVKFITYYGDDISSIWGIRTIKLFNGIDVSTIPMSKNSNSKGYIRFIAVANVSNWHGFDRAIGFLVSYQ